MIDASEFCARVEQFRDNVLAAYLRIESIETSISAIGEMYPAIPTESWQDRNGTGKYLYMLFSGNRHGGYSGPGGKRKLYVGNKPDRITEARRLAANRRRYDELQRARRNLIYWIDKQNRLLRSQIQDTYPSAF